MCEGCESEITRSQCEVRMGWWSPSGEQIEWQPGQIHFIQTRWFPDALGGADRLQTPISQSGLTRRRRSSRTRKKNTVKEATRQSSKNRRVHKSFHCLCSSNVSTDTHCTAANVSSTHWTRIYRQLLQHDGNMQLLYTPTTTTTTTTTITTITTTFSL